MRDFISITLIDYITISFTFIIMIITIYNLYTRKQDMKRLKIILIS